MHLNTAWASLDARQRIDKISEPRINEDDENTFTFEELLKSKNVEYICKRIPITHLHLYLYD